MAKSLDKLTEEIRELLDIEKLRLVDTILFDLGKPDPEIDRVWAEEARKRWAAYRAGKYQPCLMSPSWRNTAACDSCFRHLGTVLGGLLITW